MASPIPSHPPSRPTLVTPSTFTQDISRAILASADGPKSIHLDSQPHGALEYPPPPPPSPVESRTTHCFWGREGKRV
ncbi:hypothetical protein IFM61606_04356 [Aspergillus udagawae]|uniref:Uncharacterized protein n=1 Tax=Aspergillus udagawae TaxID=91492 RepID=A0ABQ1AQG0_9EURO|nr:hypothetical protein IFM51744_05541 [Aspergillus udagawae]GFF86202.1 hypothetical protein IFM53868_04733 [Aspergillus udagawae]GFG12752.1 hypothetical protein IFM5058_06103 [Aspergillus udagawae]GFG24446.1 hypothetical protein IFM61606_04356 [Aspergillus udagawae]